MNEARQISRPTVIGTIALIYLVPMVLLCAYVGYTGKGLMLLAFGLFLCASGSLAFFVLIRKWEEGLIAEHTHEPADEPEVVQKIPEIDPEHLRALEKVILEYETQVSQLASELESKDSELESLHEEVHTLSRNKDTQYKMVESLQYEFNQFKKIANDQISEQQILLAEHQQTIIEQRSLLETRQQMVSQLDGKVRDLNYELKTILKIAEKPFEPSYPAQVMPQVTRVQLPIHSHDEETALGHVQNFEEALVQLKRCLDMSQRMTGASHFGQQSRFKDLPLENYALDLRRLFDRLQNDCSGTVLVYSTKENKLLFVSDQVKHLVGLYPEKFIQSFQESLIENNEEWNRAINQLSFKNDSKAMLTLKTRAAQEILIHCAMGIIPTGIFRHYLIGVLYQESKQPAFQQ